MKRTSPRRVALLVIDRVNQEEAFANLALDGELARAGLDVRDAALATELTYGLLRRRAALDRALSPHVRAGLETLEPRLREVLRLGAYQLLYTRIPPHAAVAETVALAKDVGLSRASGLVNAVLRRVAEQGAPPPVDREKNPKGWLEVEGSLPPWLADALLSRLGAEEAIAHVEALMVPAPTAVRANLRRISREALRTRLEEESPSAKIRDCASSGDGLLLEGGGSLPRLPAFGEGLFSLQDEAAQLVTHLAGDVEGLRVLDTCAAPGGKSCHLAEHGAREVVALDRNERKVRRIGEEAARLGLEAVRPIAGDATLPLPGEGYDLVLVDAPCSALGTLRRHPELRYRRGGADLPRLVETQRAILDRAADALRPGGILVYAVCTFLREEGPQQIDAFLERQGGAFEPAPLDPAPPWSQDGWRLETWPQRQGMDAFFAARLRKR